LLGVVDPAEVIGEIFAEQGDGGEQLAGVRASRRWLVVECCDPGGDLLRRG